MTAGSTRTMVCFQSGGEWYAVPLAAVRSVRTTEGLVALPEPGADVAGILPGDPPLTVISPLRATGAHIIIVETDLHSFGLLVDEVTGLQKVDDHEFRPSAGGQGSSLISGSFEMEGRLVLVADPVQLGARL